MPRDVGLQRRWAEGFQGGESVGTEMRQVKEGLELIGGEAGAVRTLKEPPAAVPI